MPETLEAYLRGVFWGGVRDGGGPLSLRLTIDGTRMMGEHTVVVELTQANVIDGERRFRVIGNTVYEEQIDAAE